MGKMWVGMKGEREAPQGSCRVVAGAGSDGALEFAREGHENFVDLPGDETHTRSRAQCNQGCDHGVLDHILAGVFTVQSLQDFAELTHAFCHWHLPTPWHIARCFQDAQEYFSTSCFHAASLALAALLMY